MTSKTTELFDAFDISDIRFFILIAKKNIKFILIASILVSMIVFFISLNIEKKYLSEATIVIEPDENKIVNINEAYSTSPLNNNNRVNNLIAVLECLQRADYECEPEITMRMIHKSSPDQQVRLTEICYNLKNISENEHPNKRQKIEQRRNFRDPDRL